MKDWLTRHFVQPAVLLRKPAASLRQPGELLHQPAASLRQPRELLRQPDHIIINSSAYQL